MSIKRKSWILHNGVCVYAFSSLRKCTRTKTYKFKNISKYMWINHDSICLSLKIIPDVNVRHRTNSDYRLKDWLPLDNTWPGAAA